MNRDRDRDGGEDGVDGFAATLRLAVRASGLSLGQIRRRLAERGVSISVASLSYWQSGRSVPERPASLEAIGPLEDCLGVPRGFLTSRLPHARSGGADPYGYGHLPPAELGLGDIDLAVAHLGLSYSDMAWIATHDRLHVTADGTECRNEVTMILEARRDGVDRYPIWVQVEDVTFPTVTAVTNCRVGRIREFRQHSAVAVEMLLDRPLDRGESVLVEHRNWVVRPGRPQNSLWRRVWNSSREIVIEARFDPGGRVPVSGTASRVVDEVETSRPVLAGEVMQAHFVDQPPGHFRLSWEFGPLQ